MVIVHKEHIVVKIITSNLKTLVMKNIKNENNVYLFDDNFSISVWL